MSIFYGILIYLGIVSANFFVIKLYLSFQKMQKQEFETLTFMMWVPFLNAITFIAVSLATIFTFFHVQKLKREKANLPSFWAKLFNVEEIDGYYKDKEKEYLE